MMKYIHTTLFLLMLLLPLGGKAQRLEIVEDFKEKELSTVLTTYKNEFGHHEKQQVLDNKFPFTVLEVYLEGDEQAVKAAKSKLSLDFGSHFKVEDVCKTYNNRIVFLISSSVRNVYMTCGDGCKEKVVFSGQTLKQNRIYYGRVKYTPAKVTTILENQEPLKKQYFSFHVTPANATVQVLENGEWELWEKEDGVFSKSLYYGQYSYKVYADRFQMEEGTIELNDTCKEKVVKLLPDYGWLTVNSSQISKGASVFLSNIQMTEPKFIGTIPFQSKELDKGDYTLHVQQNKYKKYTRNIIIRPNETTTLTPELSPNFVSLTLSTDAESDLYVDGKRYAKGSWIGTLELGEYSIEARKQYHRSVVKIVQVTDNHANQTIEIDSPKPIYGSLHIKGSPSKASVYVDGKMVGMSPLIVNDLLIGEHQVKVEKDGCAVWKQQVKVVENEECIAKYELEKGVSMDRIVLKGLNVANLSVERYDDEVLIFTYDLPKKAPVRLRMSTDGYTYTDQQRVAGAVGKEIDKGKGCKIAWEIPRDLGRTMQDSLYFQIVASPKFPNGDIKIGSLYYNSTDAGTSVEVARPPYKKEYKFKKIAIPAEISYKGYTYSVTSIGKEAFQNCYNLTSVTIPISVTSIGEDAFRNCYNLTSVTIPISITSIGEDAFWSCSKLTSITIPNGVTSIGLNAFYATPWYDNYARGKDVVYIGKVLYKHNNAKLSAAVVKEGTISITTRAFSGCKSLQHISIPSSVKYVDRIAFNDCSSLASITVDDGNPWLDSRDNCNAIIETKTNKLIVGCRNTIIPNTVTSIGYSAFDDCYNLTSITIPNSVTSIGSSAFYDCYNLTSITIPNSVTSIGYSAFYGCDNLSEIHLPTGMEDKFNKMDGIEDFYERRKNKYSDGWNYYYGKNDVKQDYKKAASYFRIAATQGHADAQNYLGICYDEGKGVDKDYKEAAKWFRKAAEQGNKHAQFNLGNQYYYGEGVDKDYKEAVKWFKKSATQGHADAQNNLGNCYYIGTGVDKDYKEAVKWFRKAAEQGDKTAQSNLGRCYYNGNGVDEDYVEAAKWFRKAADQGSEYAKEKLEEINTVLASKNHQLGEDYFYGQNGKTKDYSQAVIYYRQAADMGHADAQKDLGICYHDGLGVEQNYVEAVKWYSKAANQGHAWAQNNLGNSYFYGEGVVKDLVEAVIWFRKSAEQGNKQAQFNMGVCYQYGSGVIKNLSEAKEWYQKAANQGHKKAVEKLKKLNASGTNGSSVNSSADNSSKKHNNHEYVDLGLSVKWATCNVGANKPEGYGDYFAWGETQPKSTYNWSTYKWCRGSHDTQTKYNTNSSYGTVDNKKTLELSDDAARANWGGAWRMPTDAEFTELREQCTWTWTTQNGVNGYKVTSKSNGNSIFLPAAGYRDDSSLDDAGSYGDYWSSSLYTGSPYLAWGVYFDSSGVDRGYGSRYGGLSVRPVCQ